MLTSSSDKDGRNKDTSVTSEELVASRAVHTGYLSGPGFVDVPVRYHVVNGPALFNGCIELGPVEEVQAHAARVRARLAGAAATQTDVGVAPVEVMGVGLPPGSDFLWTNGVVAFVVDDGLPAPERVTQAINHIHENTAIRFVARTNQANFVRFVRNPDVGWSSSAHRDARRRAAHPAFRQRLDGHRGACR